MKYRIALMSVLVACSPMMANADDKRTQEQDAATRARMADVSATTSFNTLVDQSIEVYSAISKGSQGEVPAKIRNDAKCIAVIPNVVTGALVVGGTHGDGLVSCRTASGWSQPSAVSLNQGSLGLQAGAKSADLVMYFENQASVDALKRGKFTLGADVSAVAGNYDSSLVTPASGVVVYTRSSGAFAGAAVNGSQVALNDADNQAFYGKAINHAELLDGKITPDTSNYATKLTRLF